MPGYSHKRWIIIARLWPAAFRFVTGHIREGTILLTSRARFGGLLTNILLNKVATAVALPPDLFIHGSLLLEDINAAPVTPNSVQRGAGYSGTRLCCLGVSCLGQFFLVGFPAGTPPGVPSPYPGK